MRAVSSMTTHNLFNITDLSSTWLLSSSSGVRTQQPGQSRLLWSSQGREELLRHVSLHWPAARGSRKEFESAKIEIGSAASAVHVAGEMERIECKLCQHPCAEGIHNPQKKMNGTAKPEDGVDPQSLFALDEASHRHSFVFLVGATAKYEWRSSQSMFGDASIREHNLVVFRIGDSQLHSDDGRDGDGSLEDSDVGVLSSNPAAPTSMTRT